MPERQMVRGGGKRCWEIHPLTSNARTVILSVLSLYFCCFMSQVRARGKDKDREYGEYEEYVGFACRIVAATTCPLKTDFTTYLHILKPSCNIALESSADVCCSSHQFSASLSFMCNLFVWLTSSYSGHLN